MLRPDRAAAGPSGATAPALVDPDAPAWRRAPITADQRRIDVLLAAGLLIGGVLSLALGRTAGMYEHPAPGWLSVLVLCALTLPLALRRRWPSAVALVVATGFVVLGEARVPETLFANIALFMALYSVGAWETSRARAFWVRSGIVVAMFVWLLITMFRAVTDPEGVEGFSNVGAFSPLVAYLLIQLLTNILYFAGSWWFGEHAWNAARDRARTDWRGRQLVGERRLVEEQAVAIERLRLARELHDAVAHHVSMMGVQAAAARMVLGADPQQAAAALEQVEDSAREAVDELHGLLRTLRHTGDEAETTASAVGSLGVDRLPDLVEQAGAGGLRASFQVVGEPSRVPPLTSLNLYRICQEALTNVRKHAGTSARVDVRLRYDADAVELEVADDGTGGGRRIRMKSGGLGLLGMQERVAADGGTLETGARGRGGYLVRARVPLAPRTGGAR